MKTSSFQHLVRLLSASLLLLCLLLANGAPARAAAAAASAETAASTAASAPAASASAPSPLDSLSKVLQSSPGTGTLVATLIQAEQQNSKASPEQKGFIGLISNSLDAFQAHLHQVITPEKFWNRQFSLAWQDLSTILQRQESETGWQALAGFFEMLALFGAVAIALHYIGKRVQRHFNVDTTLSSDPSMKELLLYIWRHIAPLLLALVVEISVTISLDAAHGQSLGRVLATVLLYTLVGARLFQAICAIIFSLSHGGHRMVAVHILYQRGFNLLFVIGCAGWLGDALDNPHVNQIIGVHLAGVVATLASLVAAILGGVFALLFRRPVAHIIRNRPLAVRRDHPARMETLEVVAAFWYVPILLLSITVSVATILDLSSNNSALNHALASAALLIAMFFISALLQRIRARRTTAGAGAARRQSPYILRLSNVGFSLLQLALWIGFFELLTRIWEHSLLEFANATLIGQMIVSALGKIGLTLVVAWLVWILLDTFIQESINPTRNSRYARKNPSTRMRTILPLLRNALMLLILTITVITTLANLGINVTPLLASAGVVGLAFGFGSQSLVKDLITGVFILMEDSMSVGDWVDVGNGHAGTVENLTIRTVRLRDSNGSVHSVPFSQITAIKNDSREYTYASLKLSITHDSDVDQALRLMRETGAEMLEDRRLRRLLLQPIEIYGVNGFDLNGVALLAGIRTKPQTQSEVMRGFNLRIKKKVDDDPKVHFATEWANFPLTAVDASNAATPSDSPPQAPAARA
ncbi:mechanosensitive ion channel family protein [Collimonas sp.]|jgi:small-conductance mechanosensitive channel|uniref:mechanosensitive ion channel family protein n=1 Tax=Collimonas sp. TaxID=1963772 RepID=UPI002B99F28E|nr:mechanosensitive ion channel domain-containing protein [Collimonas sp.]HWX03662.1 mechanosensitive ion channel domain-containing protein [Collimonas sp.]